MASVNKVIIVGNLGKDPELKRTPSGAPVTDFSVATTERFTDKSGNRKEETEWHNVVLWNKLAENASQYLRKGSSVYIEGKLKTRSWDDNGQKRYRTEIIASAMQFLDGKPQEQGGGNYQQQPQQQYQQNSFGEPPSMMPQMGLPQEDELPF